MRSGDEPVTARSPLRLRLGLAVFGATWAVVGLTGFAETGHPGWAAVFGAVLLLALADSALVVHRIRQGPHFQPGRDVPPYHPLPDRDRPGRRPRGHHGPRVPRPR